MPKSHRPYPAEYRQRIIDLVRKGRTPEDLARQFEPSAQCIRNWVRQADRDAGRRQDGLTTEEQDELRRLRRENRALREEREILKNHPARRPGPPGRQETRPHAIVPGAPEAVAVSFLVTSRARKKHGPGVACALDRGDARRRSRSGK
jgi:transposase